MHWPSIIVEGGIRKQVSLTLNVNLMLRAERVKACDVKLDICLISVSFVQFCKVICINIGMLS